MFAPSHLAWPAGSHAPVAGGVETHEPTGVEPATGLHVRPAFAQSTRTSWPLKQPTAVVPSHRLAVPAQGGPAVAQPAAPSAPIVHLRPKAAQSRLTSLPFSHCSLWVPEAEQVGLSPSL